MATKPTYNDSEELFSDDGGSIYSSRCGSPEIPVLTQYQTESTPRSHHSSLPNPREHTTSAVSSGKSKSTKYRPRSSHLQHTPQGRKGKELHPSTLVVPPDDNSSSDSDDTQDVRESKRRRQHSVSDKENPPSIDTRDVRESKRGRQHSVSDKENSPSIGDIKTLLVSLCEKVDKNTRALKMIKQQQHSSSVSSSSGGSPKRIIPLNIRKEVRRCYKALLLDQEGDDFQGWCIESGISIKSDENQSVIRRLIKEVRGLNPTFDATDIREAAYRFYKTKCEEESLKRTGKHVEKKTSRRRHERITRKRKERDAAIVKNSKLTEDQKKKWLSVITNDYMSSEESGEDDSIIIHPLPWRSEYVNQMFKRIDAYCENKKSPQAKRQMKRRVYGMTSSRPQPVVDEMVSRWAIA